VVAAVAYVTWVTFFRWQRGYLVECRVETCDAENQLLKPEASIMLFLMVIMLSFAAYVLLKQQSPRQRPSR
jgi:hypothetical protein